MFHTLHIIPLLELETLEGPLVIISGELKARALKLSIEA